MVLEAIRQETVGSQRKVRVPEPLRNADRVAWFEGPADGVTAGDVEVVGVVRDDDAFVDVTVVMDGFVRPPAGIWGRFEEGTSVVWLRWDQPVDWWRLVTEDAFLDLVNPDDGEPADGEERRLDYDADLSGIEASAPDLFLSGVADRFDTVESRGDDLVFEGQEIVVPPALVDAMVERGAVVSRVTGDRVRFGMLDVAVADDEEPGAFSLDLDIWHP